jgi:hypothetical protein
MKTYKLTLTITIVTLFMTMTASAQDSIDAINFNPKKLPKKGSIIVESGFNKFVGTWLYKGVDSEIILRLEKKTDVLGDNTLIFEVLIGGYEYKKNGQVIDNTLNEKPIYAKVDRNNKNHLIITVTDKQTFKGSLFTAILKNPKTLLLQVNEEQGEGIKRNPKLNFLNNATFIKVK